MKQAIQLEIQWPEAPAAEPTAIDRLEMAAAGKLRSLIPAITLFAQAVACVAFAFGIMFFAALIGG